MTPYQLKLTLRTLPLLRGSLTATSASLAQSSLLPQAIFRSFLPLAAGSARAFPVARLHAASAARPRIAPPPWERHAIAHAHTPPRP